MGEAESEVSLKSPAIDVISNEKKTVSSKWAANNIDKDFFD